MKNTLLLHYQKTKRDLPWRKTSDPYKIWVSEIFLQQTQVSRVIGFYEKFLEKYPDVQSLAKSNWNEFVPYFQGLGFYSRGRNMLKTAQIIVSEFSGKFPENKADLMILPGVGEYTSSAILSFAYQQNFPAFDVNLYRVLGRFFGYKNEELKQKINKNYKQVLEKIEKKSSEIFYSEEKISGKNDADILNHAFMDLGSSLCTAKKVECEKCPLREECEFYRKGYEVFKISSIKNPVGASIYRTQLHPSQKGVINQAPTKIKVKNKISVIALRHEKKYLLLQKYNPKNPEVSEIWEFPNFKHIKQLDHRHFLQEKSLLTLGIEISVRPPFRREIIQSTEYIISRCQILRGEFFPEIFKNPENSESISTNISGRFFSIDELKKLKIVPEFSDMRDELVKMRV